MTQILNKVVRWGHKTRLSKLSSFSVLSVRRVSGWVNNDGREQRILLTLKAIGCGLIFVKCMRKTPSNCSEQHVGMGKNSCHEVRSYVWDIKLAFW